MRTADTSYIVAIVEASDFYILLYRKGRRLYNMGAYFTVIYLCVCVRVCFVLHGSIIRLMTMTSIFLIPPNMFSTIIFQLRMTSFHVFPENNFFPPLITLA